MISRRRTALALGLAFLLVVVTFFWNRPFSTGPTRDGAFFTYVARLATRGTLPYRDVFFIHAFVHTGLLAAALATLGKVGLLLVGALVHLAMGAVAALLALGLVRERAGRMRCVAGALVASAVAVGWPFLGEFVVSGGRPKFLALALLAGMLLALSSRRCLLAGALLALAGLTWQPVAILAVGVVGGFLPGAWTRRGSASEADRAPKGRLVLRFVTGGLFAGVPLLLLLVAGGCFEGFLEQAVGFPLRAPLRPHPGFVGRVRQVVGLLPLPVLVTGGIGILATFLLPWLPGRGEHSSSRSGSLTGGLLGWLAVYAVYLWFDLDARGDMVPFLIPVGALAGGALARIARSEGATQRLAVASLLFVWLSGGDLVLPHHSSEVYKESERLDPEKAQAIARLAGGEPVLVFADPLVQNALDLDPLHPYLFWEEGTVSEIWRREEGGLPGFVDRCFRKRPKVVIVGRRALELLPAIGGRLQSGYEPSPDVERRMLPVWVRR